MHGVRKLFGRDPASITPPEFRLVILLLATLYALTGTGHSYAQIPLTLLYSSLPKLFLLLLLSLWRASSSDPPASGTAPSGLTAAELISRALEHADARPLAAVLDDGVLDRAWVVRNVLGGMAAGFGLRGALALLAPVNLCCLLGSCTCSRPGGPARSRERGRACGLGSADGRCARTRPVGWRRR
jgi:hypothetical protein